jgi:hypothetical protein
MEISEPTSTSITIVSIETCSSSSSSSSSIDISHKNKLTVNDDESDMIGSLIDENDVNLKYYASKKILIIKKFFSNLSLIQ